MAMAMSSTAMRIWNGPSWGVAGRAEGIGGFVGQGMGAHWGLLRRWWWGVSRRRGRRHGPRGPEAAHGCPSPRDPGPRDVPAPAAVRAHSHACAANVAIGDWSVSTSTSSSESRAKARHMATSSQESKVPWSSPVVSSTTVYCGG